MTGSRRALRSILVGLVVGVSPSARAFAQAPAPLVGPAREVARAVFIDPVVFDPLLVAPLTATPQAVVEARGSDISGTLYAALQNGDDSYGVVVSGPLSRDARASVSDIDPRGLRRYPALGFELTNVVWRPKASPALERRLTPDGFERLTPSDRQALARAMTQESLVEVPWVVFFHASYQFNRAAYEYVEPATGQVRSASHLNDTASLTTGLQVRVRPADPGYFFGASFIYSAVFRDADPTGGIIVGPPAKVRGNVLRFEMRRPLVRAHVGVTPSYSYDVSSHAKTIDAAAYLLLRRARVHGAPRVFGGVRTGYQSGGGAFGGVFVGTTFKTADPAASASRD